MNLPTIDRSFLTNTSYPSNYFRPSYRRSLGVVLAVFLLLLSTTSTAPGQSVAKNEATVFGGVIKSEPSVAAGEEIVVLSRGDTIEVVEGKPGFLRVVHEGKEGWLSKRMVRDSLQNLEFEGNRQSLPDLIDDRTQLRTRPVGGEVIRQLSRGDTVQVVGRKKFSFRVVHEGKEGWVPRRDFMRAEQVQRYGSQTTSPSDTMIAMAGVLTDNPELLVSSSEVIDSLSFGDTLQVFGSVETKTGTSVKVQYQEKRGWVSENMLMTKEEAREVRSEGQKEENRVAISRTTDSSHLPSVLATLTSILAWVLLSLGVGKLAKRRGADSTLWTIVALLISPILGFVVLVASTAGVESE